MCYGTEKHCSIRVLKVTVYSRLLAMVLFISVMLFVMLKRDPYRSFHWATY